MPITAFGSVTDDLDANRRNREHFISMLEWCRKHYREAGLDVDQLDSLIR